MKTIGIIGGMSWKSSLEYYKLLNKIIQGELGGFHSCKCIMYSVDFNEIIKLQRWGMWEELAINIIEAGQRLERAGADFILIASNTIHRVAKEVEEGLSIPLLHIADTTGEKIQELGIKKVGLLATNFTMEAAFYRERLSQKYNIEIIIPSQDDRRVLDHIIFNELVAGIINEISRRKIMRIVSSLSERGSQGIVLGCTELPLLIAEEEMQTRVFNSTLLHVKKGAEIALGKQVLA